MVKQTALVTGGSRGIGKAIALELAENGVDIVFNYIRGHEDARKTQQDIQSKGVRCEVIKANLAESSGIDLLFDFISEKFRQLDILINNAATGINKPASNLKEKHWDWVMGVNARAPWLCAVKASELMVNGGNIINISSLGATKVIDDYFSVGVSKAALESITRYLAVEMAPKGISVNAVSGGLVQTDALDSFERQSQMIDKGKRTLVDRLVLPEEIAKVVEGISPRKFIEFFSADFFTDPFPKTSINELACIPPVFENSDCLLINKSGDFIIISFLILGKDKSSFSFLITSTVSSEVFPQTPHEEFVKKFLLILPISILSMLSIVASILLCIL